MLLLLSLLGATAYAAPPEGADPTLGPWYRSLNAPDTGIPCCSTVDCRPTTTRLTTDGYEAWVDERWPNYPADTQGKWIAVPADKMLKQTENPTGRGVLCWNQYLGVLCFVRPAET